MQTAISLQFEKLQPFERTAKDAESLEENLDQGGTACHIFSFSKQKSSSVYHHFKENNLFIHLNFTKL